MNHNLFTFDDSGLNYDGNRISDFWPELQYIQKTVYMDEDREEKQFAISLRYADETETDTCTYLFDSIKQIPFAEYWPYCSYSLLKKDKQDILNLYLQSQIKNAQIKTVYKYSRLGIHDGFYVFGRDQIISKTGESLNLQADITVPHFPVPPSVERKDIIDFIIYVLKLKPGVSEILLLFVLLAAGKPFFPDTALIDCILVIHGRPRTGKTTMLKLFFPQISGQSLSLTNCTIGEIINTLNKYPGHPVAIDDFHPRATSYSIKQQLEKLDRISRQAGFTHTALSIMTAEYLAGSYSTQDRMVPVELTDYYVDQEAYEYLVDHPTYLNYLQFSFAESIYRNSETFEHMVNSHISEFKKTDTTHCRISYYMVLLDVCSEIFWNYYLSKEEQNRILAELHIDRFDDYIRKSISNIVEKHSQHMHCLDMIEYETDWVEIMWEMLKGPNKVFIPLPPGSDINNPVYNGLAVIEDNDYFLIKYESMRYGIRNFLGMKINMNDMLNELFLENILDEDNSHTHLKKKNGKYYYFIRSSPLEYHHQLACHPAD